MNKLASAALAGAFVLTSVAVVSAAPGDGRGGRFDRQADQQSRMGGMDMRVQRVCGIDVGFQINRLGTHLATRLNLTDAQKPAFRDLQDTAIAAINSAKSLCSDTPNRSTVTGRLAYAEKIGTAQLNVIKAVQPKLDAFYAGLDDRQKAMVDRIGAGMEGPRMGRDDRGMGRDDRGPGHDGHGPQMRRGPEPGPRSRT